MTAIGESDGTVSSPSAPPTLVVQLTIDLSMAPTALAVLSDALHSVLELPGATLRELPEVPHPRVSDERLRTVCTGAAR